MFFNSFDWSGGTGNVYYPLGGWLANLLSVMANPILGVATAYQPGIIDRSAGNLGGDLVARQLRGCLGYRGRCILMVMVAMQQLRKS